MINDGTGIVTVSNWTMMPDGETYLYLFAHWTLTTDKDFGALLDVKGFRSGERWQLLGRDEIGGEVVVALPGCIVKGLAPCNEVGLRPNIYGSGKRL